MRQKFKEETKEENINENKRNDWKPHKTIYIYIYISMFYQEWNLSTRLGILVNKNKLYNREDKKLLVNKSLLIDSKKYMLKKDSNAIYVSILDTGW